MGPYYGYYPPQKRFGCAHIIIAVCVAVAALLLFSCISCAACASVISNSFEENSSGSSQTSAPGSSSSQAIVSHEWTDCYYNIEKTSWGSTRIQCFAIIKNTGTADIYISNASFDVEDASGALVEVFDYVDIHPSVIGSGETAVLHRSGEIKAPSDGNSYKIIPYADIYASKVPIIRYDVFDVVLSKDTYGDISIAGRVKNNTDKDATIAYASILIYDEHDKPIGATTVTFTSGLTKGKQESFKTYLSNSFGLKLENIKRYEIVSYPYQWQFNK